MITRCSLFLLLCILLPLAYAQAPRPNGAGIETLDAVEPGENEFEEREEEKCSDEFRTYDGTCTNKRDKLWASAGRPHFSYFKGHTSKTPTGNGLPSARYISNELSKQAGNIYNRRRLSELFTFFGQFVDHTIVASPVDKSQPMPIKVLEDDPVFGNFSNGELPFERTERGQVAKGSGVERPINSLSSVLDLSSVYGVDDLRVKALRTFSKGSMKSSAGNYLPINTAGIRNAPTKESKYFLAGDHRANEHPVLTSLHTLFLREHNLLCEELGQKFPDWNDERTFQMARKINGAQFQKIVYEQFFPAITGRRLRSYRGYKSSINPTISDVFSTAAFRVGHTMVGNGINRRGPSMKHMPALAMQQMFFRPVDVMKEGVEPFLRGAIFNRAQEVDTLVHDSLRNFLFTGVPQENGFDLIALNIQRGRDHALPTYNEIRRMVGLRPARSFRHITRRRSLQSALAHVYKTPDRVEAWVGLMSEDHLRRSSMGPTLLRVWAREFERLRDGDRFFYRQWKLFPRAVWHAMPSLRAMFYERDTLRSIILRNTNIRSREIPYNVFRSIL